MYPSEYVTSNQAVRPVFFNNGFLYLRRKAGSELALPSIASADHVPTAATPFLTKRFVKPFLRVIVRDLFYGVLSFAA